jgi:hypothetical protein
VPRVSALSGLIVLGLTLSFASCQQFFTTSLAKPLARPPATITSIDAAGASAFLASLSQNPDPTRASSALGALESLVASNPSPAVIKDAAQVAVIATGLDSALTQAVTAVDLNAIMAGTTPTQAQLSTIANIITTAGNNVTPASTAIFTALATSASTPTGAAALASSGVGAQTLVVAAAAIAINSITTSLPAGQTLSQVLDGSVAAPAFSASTQANLTNLAAGIKAIDPNNALLSSLQGTLNIKF